VVSIGWWPKGSMFTGCHRPQSPPARWTFSFDRWTAQRLSFPISTRPRVIRYICTMNTADGSSRSCFLGDGKHLFAAPHRDPADASRLCSPANGRRPTAQRNRPSSIPLQHGEFIEFAGMQRNCLAMSRHAISYIFVVVSPPCSAVAWDRSKSAL